MYSICLLVEFISVIIIHMQNAALMIYLVFMEIVSVGTQCAMKVRRERE